jgi:hypothetical protein
MKRDVCAHQHHDPISRMAAMEGAVSRRSGSSLQRRARG